MNTNAQSTAATRFIWIPFLIVSFLFSWVFMLIGVFFMEGMRHGRPGRGQFDPYYFECCIPALFFCTMLLVSMTRLPSLAAIIGSTVAAIAATAWLAHEFLIASGEYGFASISAAIMVGAAIAAWRVRATKREDQHAPT